MTDEKKDPSMECFEDPRLVRVKDVAQEMSAVLRLLDEASPSFQSAREALGEGAYSSFMSTLCLTLFSMLSSLLMTAEERIAFAERVMRESPYCSAVAVAEIEAAPDPEPPAHKA